MIHTYHTTLHAYLLHTLHKVIGLHTNHLFPSTPDQVLPADDITWVDFDIGDDTWILESLWWEFNRFIP